MTLRNTRIGRYVRRHRQVHAVVHGTWCRIVGPFDTKRVATTGGASTGGGGGGGTGTSPSVGVFPSVVSLGAFITWSAVGFPPNILLTAATGTAIQNVQSGPSGAASGALSTNGLGAGNNQLIVSGGGVFAEANFDVSGTVFTGSPSVSGTNGVNGFSWAAQGFPSNVFIFAGTALAQGSGSLLETDANGNASGLFNPNGATNFTFTVWVVVSYQQYLTQVVPNVSASISSDPQMNNVAFVASGRA